MEKIFTSRIHKSGNSNVVVLPKNIMQALHMERGDTLLLRTYDDHTLLIQKIPAEQFSKSVLENIRL
jgi:antitoxin component of MazEF toxin-antitoxin module